MPGTPLDFIGLGDASLTTFKPPAGGSELGIDLASEPDLDPAFPLVQGYANLGQAIARRLQTPRGGLFYDPDYGTDVRTYLNSSLKSGQAEQIGSDVEAEAEKDERIQTASATVTVIESSFSLRIQLQLDTVTGGSFTLILSVDKVTVAVLDIQ